jgi:hypothetical protein
VSQCTETSDYLFGLHQSIYGIPSHIFHHSISTHQNSSNLPAAYRRDELVGRQTLKTYLSRMKREGMRPGVMTMLTNHRSVPGNKMSYSCPSRLQRTMHARATSRTFVVTYSVHVHCTQTSCDITLFMASCSVTVTLSRLGVFGNNTLNGIFAATSNEDARKVSHFITTLLKICIFYLAIVWTTRYTDRKWRNGR